MTQGKTITVATLKELFEENSSGVIPILADVQHDGIVWTDNSYEQEDHHLRLINDTCAVKYNGHKYLPSNFSFTMPEENGKKIGSTTITISAIDQRITEIIRSITEKAPKLVIESFFVKRDVDGNTAYAFSKMCHYEFEMTNVRWDSLNAQWDLVFDSTMQLNVPLDEANDLRCPAINEE